MGHGNMTSKSYARQATRHHGIRHNHQFTLNPATHAIRNAIALGLALTVSSPVFANGCDVSDPSKAVCDGFFGHTISYSIDDLNITVGGDFHTHILPAGGYAGIELYAANGSITLASAAHIQTSDAAGILAFAPNGDVSVENSGDIVTSNADGIDAYSVHGDVTVINDGSIGASAVTGGFIHGIVAVSTYGDTSIGNHGDITTTASNGYGNAASYGVIAAGYHSTLENDGSINAHGSTVYGLGMAVGTDATGYDASTNNSGIIHGDFHADTGYAGATGIRNVASSYSGVYNGAGGSVSADATAGFGKTIAYGVMASGNTIVVTNKGSIAATSNADRGVAYATGSSATNFYGSSAQTSNAGTISASANAGSTYGNAQSTGANTVAGTNASLVSYGDISATATANGDRSFAKAIGAHNGANYATQDNHGSIGASASVGFGGVAYAFGSYSSGKYGVTSNNAGSISASASTNQGFASAHALFDYSYRGDVVTTNSGDISATAFAAGDASTTFGGYAYAFGTHSYAKYNTHVFNSGTISATANAPFGIAQATGAYLEGKTASTLVNDGSILATASASSYQAFATGSDVNGRDHALTINHGFISGVAYGDFGTATAIGSGTGTWGIHGIAELDNDGQISGVANAYAGNAHATGANVLGIVTGTTNNDGSISAAAYAAHGVAGATGSRTYAFYNDAALVNTHSIVAHADAGDAGKAYAYGGLVLGADHGNIYNGVDGAISASTVASGNHAGQAFSVGTVSLGNNASLVNHGQIDATASTTGYSHAIATGATVSGDFATYSNSISYFYGSIHNVASYADNAGNIEANATAGDGIATATGLNVISAYGDANVVNAGNINATASGGTGAATGLSVTGNTATTNNAGTIHATFDGAGGKAYGAVVDSIGDVRFTNSGSITATAASDAVGIALNTSTSTTLVNSGAITAASTAATSIAVRTGDSTDTIRNTGTLSGALVTGGGDDDFTNGAHGTWNAVGSSDFGSGNDAIANAGTIHLRNAAITLGSGDGTGNQFANSGWITGSGDNRIDMGALNPNPFTNTGMLDLRNGVAGDTLVLAGDFAGNGEVSLDVGTLHRTSDMLHIAGNVTAGSVTIVNVNLVDVPATASSTVPVVDVSGDSTAGSFVLGVVQFDQARNFLTATAVNLLGNIDTSNAKPDVFSVGVAVTGLTDSGSLAASIAPGVQNLMISEVGTWRQRMGVLDKNTRGNVTAWSRVFQDSGTVNPGHVANNFGQGGNFAFDQTNSGEEVGVDFAVSDTFSAGLVLGKAQASQHLDGAGIGRNRIRGDTRGIDATWINSNGFYLDGTYRWMNFDARLNSAAGESRATGKASAFNVELGRAWAIGDGVKLEPQVQYTRTSVDHVDTLSGALNGFNPKGGDSSRGRAGLLVSKDVMASGGTVWTPYASVNAVREFDGNNTFAIDGNFSGATSTKGTSSLVEGGLNLRTGKLSVFGGVNWQDGGALKSFVGGQVGLHYTW